MKKMIALITAMLMLSGWAVCSVDDEVTSDEVINQDEAFADIDINLAYDDTADEDELIADLEEEEIETVE